MAQKKSVMIDEEVLVEEIKPKRKSTPRAKKELVEAIPVEFLEKTGIPVNTEHRGDTEVDMFGKSKTDIRKTGEVLMSKERKELIEQARTAVAREQARSLEVLIELRDDPSQPAKIRLSAAQDILSRGIGTSALINEDDGSDDIQISFDDGTKDLGV